MKVTQRTHPVAEETYRRAFRQFTEGKVFDWKERWPDGPFLALCGDDVYQIESTYDLSERARLMLTSTDEAVHMPLAIWLDLAGDVHHEAEFYARLLNRLATPKQRQHLQLAFSISQTIHRPAEGFWSVLYHLDAVGLYPKAVVAAAQVSDVAVLTLELEKALVANGKTYLNQQQEGIFETLVVRDSTTPMDALFYVFTVDAAVWEVDALT